MTVYSGEIAGDLVLRKGDDASKVTSVGGYLYISAEGAGLAALTSVGGYPVPSAETVNARMKVIAEQVVNTPQLLTMDSWHDRNECGTTHCLAGWAVHLEPDGYDLEKKVGGTLLAGNILLGPDVSSLFFAGKDKVLAKLQSVLAA
jgi:hypothetical protein